MRPLILIFALSAALNASTYYMRSDGAAASKAAATSCSAASTAMSIATHNSQTFSPGDINTVCDSGGVYRGTTMNAVSSGSSSSQITYVASGSPIITADALATWTQGTGIPPQETCSGTDIFCSGMETSSFSDWNGVTQTGVTIAQSTAQVAHGTYSMALTGNGTTNNGWLTTPTFTAWALNSTYYSRVYVYIPSGVLTGQLKYLGTPGGDFFSINGSSGTSVTGMSFVGGAGGVFINTFSTALITLNTWHYIDVAFTVSASVGGVQAWVDGTSIGSSFASDTHLDAGVTSLRLGSNGTGTAINSATTVYYDDFQINTAGPIGAFNTGGNYPTTVWRTPQSTNPYLINFSANAACTSAPSSCLGIPVSALANVTAANDWYWDGSTYLYVYGTSSPATTVEIPTLNNALTVTGKEYLTFNGITFRGGLSHDVYLTGQTSGDIFNNDIFELSYYDGWYLLENSATLTGDVLENSIFRYNGASGQEINSGTFMNFIVTSNQAYSNAQVPSSQTDHNFAAGLHAFCSTVGGSGTVFSNNTVYHNGIGAVPTPTLPGEGNGIHIDTCTGITVTGNTLYDDYQNEVYLEKDINSIATYNQITDTATHYNYTCAVGIQATSGSHATGNLIAFNTIYGSPWWGIQTSVEDSSTASILNNTIQNNIVQMTNSGQGLYVDSNTFNSGANGNVYSNNSLGVAYSCFVVFAGSCEATYAAIDSAYGSAQNNLQTSALFTNTVSGDLRPGRSSGALTASTTGGIIGALGIVQPTLMEGAGVFH